MKEYNIKTIEEFFEVANEENFERIMKDFILFANYAMEMKDKCKELKVVGFDWTDDGINEITGIKLTK